VRSRVVGKKATLTAAIVLGLSLCASGQAAGNAIAPKPSKSSTKSAQASTRKFTPQQKFVVDTVNMAVALPQPDPQDRLRVLSSAANVISPIDSKRAKNLWREGARIESDLIRLGLIPSVSVMTSGQADCASAQTFVENVPENSVVEAEQSLIGAVTSCQKQTLDIVAGKLDSALQKRIVAPRALMATMQAEGSRSQWSQVHFEEMFSSLPDPKAKAAEAENFAAMYARMSTEVEKGTAKKAGLELLDWLALQDDAGVRTLAINITTDAMKHALGEQGFQDALSGDVAAGSLVRNAPYGAEAKIERPPIESVSVLEAMKDNGADQTDRLRELPASQRAREAAAHGFAAGTSGDKQQASKYFDMAFAAVDEVWEARTSEQNTAAVVEEVSEAAAHVDSVNALTRAENLRDPSAQAISMLAVARVVAGTGLAR
jgi:hypothetical protein